MTVSFFVPFTLERDPASEVARPASSMLARARVSPAALVGVTLAHAALLGLFVLTSAKPEPISPPRPLTVSLIESRTEPARPQSKQQAKQPPNPGPSKKPVSPPPPSPVQTAQPPLSPPTQTRAASAEPTPLPEPMSEPMSETLPPFAPVAEALQPPPHPAPTPPRTADYLNNPSPPYPALSKRLGEEGVVRLRVRIDPDGSVARLELERSSGYPRLDRSAMDTVQSSWTFEPARQGDKPVAAWVTVPIQFTLRR